MRRRKSGIWDWKAEMTKMKEERLLFLLRCCFVVKCVFFVLFFDALRENKGTQGGRKGDETF